MNEGIRLSFEAESISPGEELRGTISISYPGRFDSLVISSQIENESKGFAFLSINGKKVRYPYSRLSIFKSELPDAKKVEFVTITQYEPKEGETANAKFRATLIQEHKEISADVVRIMVVRKT